MKLPGSVARPITFCTRLTLSASLLFSATLLITATVIYYGTITGQRVQLDATLLSIARSEIASATDGPNGTVHVHEEKELIRHSSEGAGYIKYAQIEDAQDHIIAQTANLKNRPSLNTDKQGETLARSGKISFADITLGNERLRCIYYPFHDLYEHPMLAIIAVSRHPMEQSLHNLLNILGMSLLAGVTLSTFGIFHMAKWITRPLQEIAAAAHQVGKNNLMLRIPEVSSDKELQEVTAVLNTMLERLDRAFSEQQALIVSQRRFVSDASHELRSPLSNLRGTVEVALRRPRSSEDYRATLKTSLLEIERLSRLVNDLLILTRADAGQFHLNRSSCDLRKIIAASVMAHSHRAEEANVRLCIEATTATAVYGDQDRLRQVIDNLLDNALRYAPSGTAIQIATWPQEDTVMLSIQDCGIGLSEESQQNVFERFYRADSSRARQSGGMGLGLAIVKAIVEAHDGKVNVQSAYGQGATFIIQLPSRK